MASYSAKGRLEYRNKHQFPVYVRFYEGLLPDDPAKIEKWAQSVEALGYHEYVSVDPMAIITAQECGIQETTCTTESVSPGAIESKSPGTTESEKATIEAPVISVTDTLKPKDSTTATLIRTAVQPPQLQPVFPRPFLQATNPHELMP